MPGYIMHMAEAKLILEKIGEGKSKQWKKDFIAGALLPDTKRRGEKMESHFWAPETLEDMAISPDLNRFLKKYRKYLNEPSVLGYYAHLHLDEQFVKKYWPEMVIFSDEEGNIQKKKKDITRACIRKTGEIITRDQFFSGEYYYGDYSRLNGYFVEKYSIELYQKYVDGLACPVEEVKVEDLYQVGKELKTIMEEHYAKEAEEVRVFTKERLCRFLEETAETFVHLAEKENVL